jgi:hypothetical protein
MNDLMKKSAIKMAVNLIGEDTIVNGLKSIIENILTLKDKTPLQDEEAELIGIVYERSGKIYGSLATVSNERRITRVLDPKNIEELILQMIKSM